MGCTWEGSVHEDENLMHRLQRVQLRRHVRASESRRFLHLPVTVMRADDGDGDGGENGAAERGDEARLYRD